MSKLESKLITDNTKLWETWLPNSQSAPLVERVRSGRPVRIIGPCAVQTSQQVEAILAVTASHSDGVRLPDKKPRTRPVKPDGTAVFLGIGHKQALQIYTTVQQDHPNLPICVETMSEADINTLAAAGILGLAWSGSRTQEQESLHNLGQAANAVNIPMMIKNPLAPDDDLFLGMMENWLLGASLAVPLLTCVRGNTSYTAEQKRQWRNPPNIDLVSRLRQSFPGLPIILDPSHMVKPPTTSNEAVNRLNTVVQLIKQGMEAGATGYMTEVHHPDHPSWTDPGENVFELMNQLDKNNLL